ncbi:MAG: hypothetical protein OXH75_28845 [Acidobacteria bacterium]|nr:hypothetical protein [Acidobacteriota bacterium]
MAVARHERVDVKAILADRDLRRKLMVRTIQATQARAGIDTTEEQAERAYYAVTEGERTALFDLTGYRQQKGQPERRHEALVRHLRRDPGPHRFDVAHRAFRIIDGAPITYRRMR